MHIFRPIKLFYRVQVGHIASIPLGDAKFVTSRKTSSNSSKDTLIFTQHTMSAKCVSSLFHPLVRWSQTLVVIIKKRGVTDWEMDKCNGRRDLMGLAIRKHPGSLHSAGCRNNNQFNGSWNTFSIVLLRPSLHVPPQDQGNPHMVAQGLVPSGNPSST